MLASGRNAIYAFILSGDEGLNSTFLITSPTQLSSQPPPAATSDNILARPVITHLAHTNKMLIFKKCRFPLIVCQSHQKSSIIFNFYQFLANFIPLVERFSLAYIASIIHLNTPALFLFSFQFSNLKPNLCVLCAPEFTLDFSLLEFLSGVAKNRPIFDKKRW